MSISDPADMTEVESDSLLDQEARLPPGAAVMAIAVLSTAAWAAVIIAVVGLSAAFQ
jgi:hypothetical protein